MDEKITGFITTEFKAGNLRLAPIDILLLGATVVFGILLRSKIWNVEAFWDTETTVIGIYQEQMLVINIIADLAAAAACALYVIEITHAKIRSFLTFSICFLSPAMAIGSGMAKTGDGVFLSFFLLAMLLFEKRRYILSAVMLALSAGAFVFVPRFSPWFTEMHGGPRMLSYNFPNLYQLIGPDAFVSEYEKAGYALTLAAVTALIIWTVKYLKNTNVKTLTVCLAFSFIVPFILPGMDERAGLLSMLLSLCFVMVFPKYYYFAVAEQITCFIAWASFFRGSSFLPMSYVAFVRLLLILLYICRIVPCISTEKKEND